eukprot:jgi/Botrbrau1/13884/Bobra.0056s0115.1
MTDGSNILSLTNDVLLKVLSCLNHPYDVLRALEACSAFKELCSDTKLWESLFWNTFYHPLPFGYPTSVVLPRQDNLSTVAGDSPWLQLYKDRWALDRRWRKGMKRQVHGLERHPAYVHAVRLLSASGLVLSAGADEEVVVWKCDGVLQTQLRGHTSCIKALDAAYSTAVSGSQTSEVFVWSLERAEAQLQLRESPNSGAVEGPRDAVRSVQLLEPQHLVVTGQQSGAIKLWDLRSGEAAHSFVMEDGGYGVEDENSQPCSVRGAQLHDHTLVAVGGSCKIHCYDTRASGACRSRLITKIVAHKRKITCMDLQYPFLATGSGDDTVKLWNIDRLSSHSSKSPIGVGSSPEERMAACLATAQEALLGTGQERCHWASGFISLRLSQDWRLITASEDGAVRIWDTGAAKGMPASSDCSQAGASVLPIVHSFVPCRAAEPILGTHMLAFPPGEPATDVPALAGLDGLAMARKATLSIDMDERLLVAGGRDSLIRIFDFGAPPS